MIQMTSKRPRKSKKTKKPATKKGAPVTGQTSTIKDSVDVWFDGVDKKLIAREEKNVAPATISIKREVCSKASLLTKTPLKPLSAYTEKLDERPNARSNFDEQSETNPSNKNHDSNSKRSNLVRPNKGLTEELAIDCEMVGSHNKSILARVSIVNLFGHVILDSYVAPQSKVTDYRTRWSGIRPADIANAPSFRSVQQRVSKLIDGRIVVGHAVHNDFSVLQINHPPNLIRDTSHYFKHLFQGTTPSLKKLSETILGLTIQKGEHDSVQDAQATMRLYVVERDNWTERFLKEGPQSSLIKELRNSNIRRPTEQQRTKTKTKPKKKKMKTKYVMTI